MSNEAIVDMSVDYASREQVALASDALKNSVPVKHPAQLGLEDRIALGKVQVPELGAEVPGHPALRGAIDRGDLKAIVRKGIPKTQIKTTEVVEQAPDTGLGR